MVRKYAPMMGVVFAALALVTASASSTSAAETTIRWSPDLIHSRAEFTVAHMVLSKVWGHLPIRDLQIETSGTSLMPQSVSATLDVTHLDTDNHERDADLRSPTYFDTAKYPTITFRSTSVERVSADACTVMGDLTIRGVSKHVALPVHMLGRVADGNGTRVGWEATLTIDRRDFGITDTRLMQGVLFVGDAVTIGLTAEATSALPFSKN